MTDKQLQYEYSTLFMLMAQYSCIYSVYFSINTISFKLFYLLSSFQHTLLFKVIYITRYKKSMDKTGCLNS